MRFATALAALAMALGAIGAAATPPVPVAGAAQSFTYGSGTGLHPYVVYTPVGYSRARRLPLIVLLHGCHATDYQQMDASNYNPLADAAGFVVLYPDVDQLEATGLGGECWQYNDAEDWLGGGGDPAAVSAMTRAVIKEWNIDPQRVYLIGVSAGAFLTSEMAALYPNLYAAVGEDAGGAYADIHCLAGTRSTLSVAASARDAYWEGELHPRVVPRIVIGGDRDQVVPEACADKAIQQGLRTDNLVLDQTQTAPIRLTPVSVRHSVEPGGDAYSVSDYVDQYGCLISERVLVHGMKHDWSGGSPDPASALLTDPRGPSAAVASWNFFRRFTLANTVHPC
jgi:poly(hydroxyalkanoate) depolymerase family esterase